MRRRYSAVFRGRSAAKFARRSSAAHFHDLNRLILDLYLPGNVQWTVLDIGAGSGELGSMARDHVGVWVDLDLSFDLLRCDPQRRASRVLGESTALPFLPHSFDAAVLKFSLHHIGDAERLFSELARVLKPGGICILIDPFFVGSPVDRVKLALLIARAMLLHGLVEFFCTYRTLKNVKEMVAKEGFLIEEESSSGLPTALKWLPTKLLKLRRIAVTQT